MARRDWESNVRTIGLFLNGKEIHAQTRRGEPIVDESFIVLLNAGGDPVTYRLPPRRFGARWRLEISTAEPGLPAGDEPSFGARAEITLEALSLVLLRPAW